MVAHPNLSSRALHHCSKYDLIQKMGWSSAMQQVKQHQHYQKEAWATCQYTPSLFAKPISAAFNPPKRPLPLSSALMTASHRTGLSALPIGKFGKESQYSNITVKLQSSLCPIWSDAEIVLLRHHSIHHPNLTPLSVQPCLLLHLFAASSFPVADRQQCCLHGVSTQGVERHRTWKQRLSLLPRVHPLPAKICLLP